MSRTDAVMALRKEMSWELLTTIGTNLLARRRGDERARIIHLVRSWERERDNPDVV